MRPAIRRAARSDESSDLGERGMPTSMRLQKLMLRKSDSVEKADEESQSGNRLAGTRKIEANEHTDMLTMVRPSL